MHLIYTFLLPALAATAEAVACASAPFTSTPFFNFNRQSNGVWVAQFTGGYVNYAPGGLSAAGVVKLVNETPDRKVFCLQVPSKGVGESAPSVVMEKGQKVSETLRKATRPESSQQQAVTPTSATPARCSSRAPSVRVRERPLTNEDETDEDETDDAEDSPGNAQTDRPVLPIPRRSQEAAQKPNHNVANAYNHLELGSVT
ncbi:uncharacterized protein CCOS01_17061 [Colletotrichum costaricense]|uniref:Uncharacterized protein n=1 Tax=Colletotrichum costaricense TaxID=1209916 RepID=A0AAI9YEC4_9PEZI|nr:uncharacterized protein CCOS01_17061 [Colletotrichum costaricense]KAK1503162.1 hypothetical protein CCOS01_17061 [Colletotrichum costaricense]